MKVLKAKKNGLEVWLVLTNKGTVVAQALSEAGARTKAAQWSVKLPSAYHDWYTTIEKKAA